MSINAEFGSILLENILLNSKSSTLEIKELVSHLKDKGVGVLITDHNVRETMGLIDRAVLIHEGSVLIEGKPEDIIKNDDVRRVYLGERFSI